MLNGCIEVRMCNLDLDDQNSKKALSNEKGRAFFHSVLEELHKSGVDVSVLADFIRRAWELDFHDSTWISLLSEYNTLEKEIVWRQAFLSGSDTLIIEAWINYGNPVQLTLEEKELLHSAISRFGALAQIKQARNDKSGGNSKKIEHLLSSLFDSSDLIFMGKNKK